MKKGTIFILLAVMLFSGIFGGASPVNAATVAQTDSYLKLAESAAKKLAPQLTFKGNAELKEVDLQLFIQTRDNLNKTKSALKTLRSADQQKFASRIKYVQTVYDRAVAFRAAVYQSKVITNSKENFVAKYKVSPLSSDTEKAYNDLVNRINVAGTTYSKVYDNLARATFISNYLKPAQSAIAPYVQNTLALKQEITSVTNDVESLERAIETNQPQAALERLNSTIESKLAKLQHPETVAQLSQRLKAIQESYKVLFEKKFLEWSISEMILDESKGYLYLLSRREDKLYIVSSKDLRTVKELPVWDPTHMELYEGKLYISASPTVIVNLETVTTKPISTPLPPITLFKIYDDQMFYAMRGPEPLRKLNLNTGVDTEVNKEGTPNRDYSFWMEQMALDKENGILYFQDSTHIRSLDLNTYDLLSQDNYSDGYGFSNSGKLLYDRGDVFFSRYRFDANDLTTIHGRYLNEESHHDVRLIRDRFVYTSLAVFDRENYKMIRKLPIKSNLMVMDSSGNMYSYEYKKLTKMRVTILPAATTDIQKSDNQIKMKDEVTDWVYDEENDKIYIISKYANKLFVINAKTYNIEKTVFIGSYPIDIELKNGKIYVALYGASKIAVLPAKAEGTITHIKTEMIPGQLAVDDKAVYYTDLKGTHDSRPLYMYSFATGKTINLLKQLKSTIGYQTHAWNYKRLAVDPNRPILYVNEGNGDKIYSIDTINLEVVDQSVEDSYQYPDGSPMFVDQNHLYNVFYAAKKDDLKSAQVKFEQPVIYVGTKYIFTRGMVYKKDDFEKIAFFNEEIDSGFVNKSNEVFLLSKDKKVFTKYPSLESVPQTSN
ncbi:hypothetical protein ABE65_018360 [Fictibacillus phosphorivorans]|uniref:SbsC C-terminal domain-containing protein n=1 Tax=Fictibacillus phosphorivorans TaxID=1221500 RepID=A0A160IRR0_9BACL|nr:hypothetical protein [Fictibacillus phosphorivorans]ANC78652.1 hypothetical protein ABE65_018360 [Fictibacillus phosphorivorans]